MARGRRDETGRPGNASGRRSGQAGSQKPADQGQGAFVDPVSEPGQDVNRRHQPGPAQNIPRMIGGDHRNHGIGIPMKNQGRGTMKKFPIKGFRRQQGSGQGNHRPGAERTAQSGMKGHHSTLGKAEQDQPVRAEPLARKQIAKKGIEIARRPPHPGFQTSGLARKQAEPLSPHRRHVAGLGPVGRKEESLWQRFRQLRGKADQIIAIGAHTMKHHHETIGPAFGNRTETRPGKGTNLPDRPCFAMIVSRHDAPALTYRSDRNGLTPSCPCHILPGPCVAARAGALAPF